MDPNSQYFEQAQMLVRTLPTVAAYDCFALKGGTAINLFVRDLPRLSVDIDLVYLPHQERSTDLSAIHDNLLLMKSDLERTAGFKIDTTILPETGTIIRLIAVNSGKRIKIEVSPVLRGSVRGANMQKISAVAGQLLGFAEARILHFDDLFAGKLCAALDRQHPRDLFDVRLLLDNEGINIGLKDVFLVYLLSHPRPISELLAPHRKSLRDSFAKEFSGMTRNPVTMGELEETLDELIRTIRNLLTDQDKHFLIDVKNGTEDWNSFPLPHAATLPSIRWKRYNISKMTPSARRGAIEKLSGILWP